MKTFKMEIILDRQKDKGRQIEKICTNLRKKGRYPQGYTLNDRGTVTIRGNISCDCRDQFDKVYCDENCTTA